VAGLDDAGVGHEEDAFATKFRRQFTDAFNGVRAEDEPRAGNEVEQSGRRGSVAC
jgi:hypothetical protein